MITICSHSFVAVTIIDPVAITVNVTVIVTISGLSLSTVNLILTVAVIITVIAIFSVTVTVIVFVSAPVSVAVTGYRKAHTVRVKCLVHGHSTTMMTRPKLKDLPIQNPAY